MLKKKIKLRHFKDTEEFCFERFRYKAIKARQVPK